ncbi:MAG: hypothetical protein IH614_04370, partial [Desulfuromonadales bacterium]|nr:hypothetical protein [Desulfuromonadales bacterium]
MVVGYNHNFRYKGVLYHVQTEDGGRNSPAIITHLFTGGTILSSKKTSYADILKIDRLESVVEELMKEQHREMLRRLRDGELDATISARSGAAPLSKPVSAGVPASADQPLPAPPAERPALASRPPEGGFRP